MERRKVKNVYRGFEEVGGLEAVEKGWKVEELWILLLEKSNREDLGWGCHVEKD